MRLVISRHAEDRMLDRQISRGQILKVLTSGVKPIWTNEGRGGAYITVANVDGKPLQVVWALADANKSVVVKSVYWPDQYQVAKFNKAAAKAA